MSKRNIRILVGIVGALLIAAIVVFATNPNLFQGRFGYFKRSASSIPCVNFVLYEYRNNVVSGVTSPVTSIVVSNVVSYVNSRAVTSRVPSAVISSVTSPVTISGPCRNFYSKKKLKRLTPEDLIRIAKEDYMKNPKKFTLSTKEKERMIQLYEQKNTEQKNTEQFNVPKTKYYFR